MLDAVLTLWSSLPEEQRELVPVAVAVIGVLIALLSWNKQRSLQTSKSEVLPGFPFKIYSTENLKRLKVILIGRNSDLSYMPRLPASRQEKLLQRLQAGNVLLTGRAGLGKSREVIEAIERLAEAKGQDITVLVPEEYMDVPFAPPPDLPSKNLVLLIDDIHQRCVPIVGRSGAAGVLLRDFHQRLGATIDELNKRFAGSDIRLLFTARDEPELRSRLKPDSFFWKEYRFDSYHLPGVHKEVRPEFVRSVAQHFGHTLTEEAIDVVCRRSDGTPGGVVTAFAGRGAGETLTAEGLAERSFTYPRAWKEDVYVKEVVGNTKRQAIFEALVGLHRLRLPPHRFLVVDVAARLWGRWPLMLWRRALDSVIDRELVAWMFEFEGQIVCPNAYLNEIDVSEERIDVVGASVARGLRRKQTLRKLVPHLDNLVTAVWAGNVRGELGVEILEAACNRAGKVGSVWLSLAKLRSLLGKEALALEAAKKAVKVDGKLPDAHYFLSLLYTRRGLDEKALKASKRGTELAGDSGRAWVSYGVCLSKADRHDEAIVALEKACDLEPTDPKAFFSLGIAYHRAGKLDAAIEKCKRAVSLDPYDPVARLSLGISYDRAGKTEEAVQELVKARELDADDVTTLVSLSRVYFGQGRLDEAEEVMREAEKRAEPSELATISVAYGMSGRPEEAVAAARRALELDSDLVEAKRSLAINLAELGTPEESEEAIELLKVLADTKGRALDWSWLSLAYAKSGQRAEAVAAARRALELDSDLVGAKRSLVNLVEPGTPAGSEEAIELLKVAAETKGRAPDWSWLSVAYGKAARPEEAVAAARRALELDSDLVEAKRSLVNLVEPGTPAGSEEAIELLKVAAETTGRALDWWWLSVAYGKAARPEEAVAAARRALELDSDLVEAKRSLAINLAELGTPEESEEAIELLKVLADTTGRALDWWWLSVAYGKAARPEEAVAAARRALELDSDLVEAKRSLGINLAELGTPAGSEEAIKLLTGVAETTGRALDWWWLSLAYGKAGRPEEAVAAARRALELDSDLVEAKRSLGINLAELGTPAGSEEAIKLLTGVAETTGRALDWSWLSLAYGKAGRPEEAVAAARRALELDSDLVEAKRSLGINLVELGTPEGSEEAIKLLTGVAETTGRALDWSWLSSAYGKAGEYQQGARCSVKALSIDRHDEIELAAALESTPDDAKLWRLAACSFASVGQYNELVSIALRFLQPRDKTDGAVFSVVEELKEPAPEEALRVVRQLIQTNESNPDYWNLQGVLQRETGDLAAALESHERALAIKKNYPPFWYALGRAYEELGDREGACEAYDKALSLKPNYSKVRRRRSRLCGK